MGTHKGRKPPPLKADDFKRVLRALGYVAVDGTKHLAFEHPDRPGKVNVDEKWTGVKSGSWVFRSVVHEQMGLTTAEFFEVYWRTR